MQIEIQRTRKDYESLIRFIIRKILLKLIVFVIVVSVIAGVDNAKSYLVLLHLNFYIKFAIAAAALFFIFLLLPYIWLRVRYSKLLKTYPRLLEKKSITISDEGISYVSVHENNFFQWHDIKEIESNKEYIFITFLDKSVSIIPDRSFLSTEDAALFNTILLRNFSIAKKTVSKLKYVDRKTTPVKAKDGSHLYYWGFLGLIPNIGVVAGIYLIYNGIIRYKKKWLVIIGLADILFTIIFWTLIFPNLSFDLGINDVEKQMAQAGVNQIVKNIEFYKMQTGVYPDSLEQLGLENTFPTTVDYFSIEDSNKNKQDYIYKKVQYNRYTLFSVGMDHIPYTKDDICPTVTFGDTTKFGWIHLNK